MGAGGDAGLDPAAPRALAESSPDRRLDCAGFTLSG